MRASRAAEAVPSASMLQIMAVGLRLGARRAIIFCVARCANVSLWLSNHEMVGKFTGLGANDDGLEFKRELNEGGWGYRLL